jgi:hypothetical protein
MANDDVELIAWMQAISDVCDHAMMRSLYSGGQPVKTVREQNNAPEWRRLLHEVADLPQNRKCVDCSDLIDKATAWASINLGRVHLHRVLGRAPLARRHHLASALGGTRRVAVVADCGDARDRQSECQRPLGAQHDAGAEAQAQGAAQRQRGVLARQIRREKVVRPLATQRRRRGTTTSARLRRRPTKAQHQCRRRAMLSRQCVPQSSRRQRRAAAR